MRRTIVCLMAIALLAAASKASSQGMPPTLVGTDTVSMMEFHEQVTLVGRSEGASSGNIVSEVAGRVAAIVAAEGNPIERGATLIEIDSDRMRLDLAAKEAELIEVAEQMALAQKNLARNEELFTRKLTSQITLDSARAWITIADARHKKVTAERDRLSQDLQDSRVKAPYSGYTSRRLINVGEWVNRGTPVYEMVDISKLKVVADLPERHFGRLSIGGKAVIYASNDTTKPLIGSVTGIARSANLTTHTFPVIVTVDNPDAAVGGGALVRATLSLDQVFTSMAVNKDAIVRQGNQTMVYTIHEGTAAPVPVVLASSSGNMVAVSGDGVRVGMTVVVRGNERIFPGAPVRTADGSQQEGGTAAPTSP